MKQSAKALDKKANCIRYFCNALAGYGWSLKRDTQYLEDLRKSRSENYSFLNINM